MVKNDWPFIELFPSTQLPVNMLWYSTQWTASVFGNECLWLTLLVKGVNDCLLDNCQISSLPHDCVSQWTKLRHHFEGSGNLCRCFALISWLACHHILICWDEWIVNWWVLFTCEPKSSIKRTKDLNYFILCALNLFNTRVLQFELNYWNKLTFPRHSNLLRCTCTLVGIPCTDSRTPWNSLTNHHGFANPTLGNPGLEKEDPLCVKMTKTQLSS